MGVLTVDQKIFVRLNKLELKHAKLMRDSSDLTCLVELINVNQSVLEDPTMSESWMQRQYGRQAGYLVEMINKSPNSESDTWLGRLVELLQEVDRRYSPAYHCDDKRTVILSIRAFLAAGKRLQGLSEMKRLCAPIPSWIERVDELDILRIRTEREWVRSLRRD